MSRSAQVIQDWLVARVSALTRLPPETIDAQASYDNYGLDSVMMVTLVVDLQTWLGWEFRENPLEDHTTLASLAQYVAECDAAQDVKHT